MAGEQEPSEEAHATLGGTESDTGLCGVMAVRIGRDQVPETFRSPNQQDNKQQLSGMNGEGVSDDL